MFEFLVESSTQPYTLQLFDPGPGPAEVGLCLSPRLCQADLHREEDQGGGHHGDGDGGHADGSQDI